MRIILLINSLNTGGAEFSTLSFYSWVLSKSRDEVTVVCLKRAKQEYNLKDFGIENTTYLSEGNFNSRLSQFKLILNDIKPDIVHSVLFDANLLGRAARHLNSGFVHLESLVNETYSSYRLRDPKVNIFKLQAYRFLDYISQLKGVDHFHANGESVAKHYRKELNISNRRITVVPRGRKANPYAGDLVSRNKIREELNTINKVQLINVARHEYQKAQHILLDALNLLKSIPQDFILLLVGREGELTKDLRKQITDYNLEEKVVMLGHRNDIPELLAASDIFVFPSRFEGLPGALIEAEAAGLPIICSDIPNNLEVVNVGSNALTFTVDNPEILSERLRDLIMNSEKCLQMGKMSSEIFYSNFQLEEVHERLYDLLVSLNQNKCSSKIQNTEK